MIGVTGVTGHIGGQVAQLLRADGLPFAMLARRPDRVTEPVPDMRRCVYGDPESAVMSLTGVTTLLMVSASESPTRVEEHRTFIDAAADAGVEHIVYTSSPVPRPMPYSPWLAITTPPKSICVRRGRHTRSCATTST